ncbi:hypothetical protein GPECTOR_11g241 [Gonium pectorale]|uniref:BACK domain-containing protein n=1 Tax=Gonium pectorale TaxID=33097 RepID=A0A150GPP3_GONPE|nr:hypothetical protein GPECTOR_11g241 [Gonium pectorale]|eukprot:KXZ51799.1 hypothetical protein GPECTOR_11g241 [Gonium pectorale]
MEAFLSPAAAAEELGPVVGPPLPAHRGVLRSCSKRLAQQLAQLEEGGAQGQRPAIATTAHDGADATGSARGSDSAPVFGLGATTNTAAVVAKPVLRVPLGSEAELPGALAAIRFAYTGEVAAASVREALEVHKQATLLGIEGCGAVCCDRIRSLLIRASVAMQRARCAPGCAAAAGTTSPHGGSGRNIGAAAAAAAASPPHQPFLQLFECPDLLWPAGNSAGHPGFAALLKFARQLLVAWFGDALAVLNSPELRGQMVQLPPRALEALLESDDFGTDTESSVLLLVAEWMAVNRCRTDAATRERLCRQVRLTHLSRAYLTSILPLLAADSEAGPNGTTGAAAGCAAGAATPRRRSGVGWFPITIAEAALIAGLASASPEERSALESLIGDTYDINSPWYGSQPRLQCLVAARERVFGWHVTLTALTAALAVVQEPGGEGGGGGDRTTWVDCSTGFGAGAFANGFLWKPQLAIPAGGSRGDVNASGDGGGGGGGTPCLVLGCHLPRVFDSASGSSALLSRRVSAVTSINARLTVHRWAAASAVSSAASAGSSGGGGARDGAEEVTLSEDEFLAVGDTGYGLPLNALGPSPGTSSPAMATAAGGAQQAAAAAAAPPPVGWSAYLNDGRVTGELVLLPHRAAEAAEGGH